MTSQEALNYFLIAFVLHLYFKNWMNDLKLKAVIETMEKSKGQKY